MNCIYQHWDGPMPQGEVAGRDAMREYAQRIGAFYRFDKDAYYFGDLKAAYGRFRVFHDSEFEAFQYVMYADTDVWPVDGLQESPFGFDGDLAICTEPLQPMLRRTGDGSICTANDEKWAEIVRRTWGVEMPRENGLLKVYNAGVQVWSRAGRDKARKRFISFREYIKAVRGLPRFYASDQHYIHVVMFLAGLDVVELDNDWNRYVHYLTKNRQIVGVSDQRTDTAKLVHVQLRSAGEYDAAKLRRIVNLPQEQWAL